ncbi:hypothetical protein K7432_001219 [Basidiobolus ranarum]|uniref:Uncharacterized protein n=1 Tax=Basidiobolus ranarum TaxID=34480 RepID=A0ABR2W9Z8_9FUNG
MATIDEGNNSISELLNSAIGLVIEKNPASSNADSSSLETKFNASVSSSPPVEVLSMMNNKRPVSKKSKHVESSNTEEKLPDEKAEAVSEKIKPFPKMKRSVKYSVEQLLVLSKSPLVKCPDIFPDVTTWIGDSYYEPSYREREPEAERKKIYNGEDKKVDKQLEEIPNKSGEKSIILGPPKMSFASSQKQTMINAKSSEKAANRNPKNAYNLPRHIGNGRGGRNDDNRNEHNGRRSSNTGMERERNYSKERENTTGRKGPRETRDDFERGSSRETQGNRNRNNQNSGQNRKSGGRDGNVSDRNRHFHQLLEKKLDISNDHRYTGKQDTPEWMNYDPETEKNENQSSNTYSAPDEAGYVDEIQAWKSRQNDQSRKKPQDSGMNPNGAQVEGWRNTKATGSISDSVPQNTVNTDITAMFKDENSRKEPVQGNIDYLFGPGGLNFNQQHEERKNMEKPFPFKHQNASEIEPKYSEEPTSIDNEREGAQSSSRFFRLFQKENNNESSYVEPVKSQDSAMLSRLLMGNQAGQAQNNLAPTSVLSSSAQTNKKMLSEADVLRTLGVTNSGSQQNMQSSKPPSMNTGSHVPGRMMTEEDIFKQLGAKPSQSQQRSQFRSNPAQHYDSSDAPEKPKMSSEADILKTLGVNTHPKKVVSQNNSEDKTGFNMIMARLSTNKTPSDSMNTNEKETTPRELPKSHNPPNLSTFSDSSIVATKKPELPTPGNNATSSKSIAALFAGNIPTSVYRQLSSKNEPGSFSPIQKSSSMNSPIAPISPAPGGQFQSQAPRSHYTAPGMTNPGNNLGPMSGSSPMIPFQSPSSGLHFEEPTNLRSLSPSTNNMNKAPLYRPDHVGSYGLGGAQRPPAFFDQLLNNGQQQRPILQHQHPNLRQQPLHHNQFLPHLQQNSYMIPPSSSPYSSRDQFGMSGREPPLPNNMGGFPMRPPPYMGGQPLPYDSARRPPQNNMSGRMMTVEEIERLSMR